MIKTIQITDLASPCITRMRGKEAAAKLLEIVKKEQVIIDLNESDSLSVSFLDEIIFWLATSANLQRTIFKVNSKLIRDKLAHIASFRNTTVLYYSDDTKVRELDPKAYTNYETSFMADKSLLKL